jgi:hypothetical protein
MQCRESPGTMPKPGSPRHLFELASLISYIWGFATAIIPFFIFSTLAVIFIPALGLVVGTGLALPLKNLGFEPGYALLGTILGCLSLYFVN